MLPDTRTKIKQLMRNVLQERDGPVHVREMADHLRERMSKNIDFNPRRISRYMRCMPGWTYDEKTKLWRKF